MNDEGRHELRSGGAARLTPSDVRAIRGSLTGARGEQAALARRYGVTTATINAIARGVSWRDV